MAAQDAGWSVRQSAMMDLWFHAMATIGFDRGSPLAFYQPGYAGRVRHQRDRRGLGPTPLERRRDAFLAAFQHDSAFEILHFLPVYFAAADREAMLSALGEVASKGARAVPEVEPSARFGAAAANQTLGRPQQRRELGELAQAVATEWNAAYGTEWRALVADGAPVVREADRRWRAEFAPALQPFLRRYRLDGGVIIAVPSLGPDGRVFEGSPGKRDDTVVVVALPTAGDPADILFAAVRELCFPAVRQLIEDPVVSGEGEQVSSDAAVRCGDLLLGRYLPAEREAYRRFWLTQRGVPGSGLEAAFPLAPGRVTALAQAITRAP